MIRTWKTKTLADVAELQGRIGWKGLTAKEYTSDGPYFLSVHSLNHGDQIDFRDAFHISQNRYNESPEIMLRRDDVLICKDGAGIGKVGIVGAMPGPSTINSSLLLIRAKSNILPKYLYHVLQSPYFQAIVQSRLEGATTPHLYQRDIATFPVQLPPLEEQRRIVTVLDEAFAAIATVTANAEKNLANARELFASTLATAFDGEAKGWPLARLGAIGRTLTGNTPKTSKPENFGNYIPFIKPGDFRPNGSLGYGNEALSEEGAKGSRVIPAGSALMVCIGATIGKSGYAEQQVAANQQVNALIPDAGIIGKFVFYQFLTKRFQSAVLSASGQATLPIINKSKWTDLEIYIPDSEDEQHATVKLLDGLMLEREALETVYVAKIATLAHLKQCILHRVFADELNATMPGTIAA